MTTKRAINVVIRNVSKSMQQACNGNNAAVVALPDGQSVNADLATWDAAGLTDLITWVRAGHWEVKTADGQPLTAQMLTQYRDERFPKQ